MTIDERGILEWYVGRHGEPPEIRETHISFVLLGERYVYKFKKPVRFSFLDYSTPEKRLGAALEEIRCNLRLTTGVYLGLCLFDENMAELPSLIATAEATPIIGEVAVVMRRLPEGQHLNRLLEDESFDATRAVRRIAERIAAFHSSNSVSVTPRDHLSAVTDQCRDNVATLQREDVQGLLCGSSRRALRLTTGRAMEDLERLAPDISRRAADGCVVEGHGDIRLEHICIEKDRDGALVQIYDCVEFDKSLRIADLASDLAFLAMELDLRGRADLSNALCSRYAETIPGLALEPVLTFYKGYRALVRAKVSALGAMQASGDRRSTLVHRVESHIALASRYALGLHRPVIFALSGLMGVGKTVLANTISAFVLPAVHSADRVRREIFAAETAEGRGKSLAFGAGAYTEQGKRKVYSEICRRASADLGRGRPVILDASFMYRWQREVAKDLAGRHGCPLLMVECRLDPASTLERLAARAAGSPGDPSDGRAELYDRQRAEWESILPEEGFSWITADMSEEPEVLAEQIVSRARSLGEGRDY